MYIHRHDDNLPLRSNPHVDARIIATPGGPEGVACACTNLRGEALLEFGGADSVTLARDLFQKGQTNNSVIADEADPYLTPINNLLDHQLVAHRFWEFRRVRLEVLPAFKPGGGNGDVVRRVDPQRKGHFFRIDVSQPPAGGHVETGAVKPGQQRETIQQ